MAYRWRYNSITGSMLVNAREYDKNYSQYTSIINGGTSPSSVEYSPPGENK